MPKKSLDEIFGSAPAAPAGRKSLDDIFAPAAPAAPVEPEKPGMLRQIGTSALHAVGDVAASIGRTVDRVSPLGAALRSGVSAVEDVAQAPESVGKSAVSLVPKQIGAGISGYLGQYGRDPERAPTSEKILERAGVDANPSPRMKQVNGSWVPGIPDAERVQDGKGGYVGPDQGTSPSPAASFGGAIDLAMPLGIPGSGALKVAGKAIGPGMHMMERGAEGVAKAADVATGTKVASTALGASKTVAKATAGAFKGAQEGFQKTFKAKQADDFGESVKTAMANGIDPKLLPEAVEFGPNSIVSRTARVQAEGITGQSLLDRHTAGLDQVRDAVRSDIEKIGLGAPLTKPDAGRILRDGFNAGVDRAFDAVNTSHSEIIKEAPNLRLSQPAVEKIAPKLAELEVWAAQKAKNGLTNTAKGQGQQLLNAISAFRKKGESYAGAYEALQEIGDVAFKSKNNLADIPPDISRFRKLYGDISEAMVQTVDDAFGADKGKLLRESNESMHKIYGDKSLLGKLGQEATSDEQLFQSIIEHGDTKRIAALKPYLEPEQLQALKGAFLNQLIKESTDGAFPFKSLHNALRTKGTVASALFDPGELDNLQSLIKLGDKFGHAIMSTSGTGASNAIRESVTQIGNAVADNAISGGIKDRARAIGFDVSNPMKNAAQGPSMPPTMSLSPQGIGSHSVLQIPDWRKRGFRGYANQQGEEDQ